MSAINISEIYHHLILQRSSQEADECIQFVLKTSFVVQLDASLALAAARLKKEKKMGLADAIVLATAKAHRCSVVTGDPYFKNEKETIYFGK